MTWLPPGASVFHKHMSSSHVKSYHDLSAGLKKTEKTQNRGDNWPLASTVLEMIIIL